MKKIERLVETAAAPQFAPANPQKKEGFMLCQIEWHELSGKWVTTHIGWYTGSIEKRLKEEADWFDETMNDGYCYHIFAEKKGANFFVYDCLSIGDDHHSRKDADPAYCGYTPTEALHPQQRTQRASIGWYAYPCGKGEFLELTSELTINGKPLQWIDGKWKGGMMLWLGKPGFDVKGKYYLPR